MTNRALRLLFVLLLAGVTVVAQQQERGRAPVYRIEVDLVLMNVAVTDRGGHYIHRLRPSDFRIFEDGIPQKLSAFSEGGAKPEALAAAAQELPKLVAGSSVFILFDTSNMAYRGFVHAQDAISQFIHGVDPQDSIALYGFSRNLSRACPLTTDRRKTLVALRQLVAGDDTSLYNALLLTLEDAAKVPGRKVVVVFSNGPDTSSMLSPEAVRELAESEGVPIYIISTQDLEKDKVTALVFRRLSTRTGGRSYQARNWRNQTQAFRSVRDDLDNMYLLSYYPAANPNLGWRRITVELTVENANKYRVRTRTGYRPKVRSEP
jgi:Ca-activated chloride channel family protein